MKYRKGKYGNEISALGYGCMRFPQTLGKINKEKTEQQILLAIENCVGCGKCEQHCPQYIPIREELKNAQKHLEGPLYKMLRKLLSIFDLF